MHITMKTWRQMWTMKMDNNKPDNPPQMEESHTVKGTRLNRNCQNTLICFILDGRRHLWRGYPILKVKLFNSIVFYFLTIKVFCLKNDTHQKSFLANLLLSLWLTFDVWAVQHYPNGLHLYCAFIWSALLYATLPPFIVPNMQVKQPAHREQFQFVVLLIIIILLGVCVCVCVWLLQWYG